jgi:hypothetical protein
VCGSSPIHAGEARPWGDWGLLLANASESNSSLGGSANPEDCNEASVVDTALFGRVLVVCECLSPKRWFERAQSIANVYNRGRSSRGSDGTTNKQHIRSSEMATPL